MAGKGCLKMISPVIRGLRWVIEVYYRGSLVDIVGPMSFGSMGVYYQSLLTRYFPDDGYKLRLVGYK